MLPGAIPFWLKSDPGVRRQELSTSETQRIVENKLLQGLNLFGGPRAPLYTFPYGPAHHVLLMVLVLVKGLSLWKCCLSQVAPTLNLPSPQF